jgi:hypothetical protein
MIGAAGVGSGFRQLGILADGPEYAVFNVLSGGPPEFSISAVLAAIAYGIAISLLGVTAMAAARLGGLRGQQSLIHWWAGIAGMFFFIGGVFATLGLPVLQYFAARAV